MATTNYSWTLPTVGGSEDSWGTENNTVLTAIDTLLGGTDATEFAILNGATVSTAELNILDGVTATAAELNALDGITATVTELNYTDGVTSAIQTQLDAKQASDATLTAFASLLTAANKVPYATAADTGAELDLQTTLTDSDTSLPTSGAVVDYVAANAPSDLVDSFSFAGAAVTRSGLDLSGYRFLKISVNNLDHSSTTQQLTVAGYDVSGESGNTGWEGYGIIEIDLNNGTFSSGISWVSSTPGSSVAGSDSYAGDLGITTATTSITFDGSAQRFSAGDVRIYGFR